MSIPILDKAELDAQANAQAPTEDEIDLSNSEFYAISRSLERHHALFYQLWELGKPVFTTSIPTACVRFNKDGQCVEFCFNPKFWKKLTPIKREFIIAHECLHVILKHGLRAKNTKNMQGCNMALDVVVNHLLVDKFDFLRKDIDAECPACKAKQECKEHHACWIDTVFPDNDADGKPIQKNREFEYYFNRLPEAWKKAPLVIDLHDFLSGSAGGDDNDANDDGWAGEVIAKLNKSLTDEEKSKLKEMVEKHSAGKDSKDGDKAKEGGLQAGDTPGHGWKFVSTKPVSYKKKWETVIRRWAKKFLPNDFDSFEHWARVNRRIVELPQECILPTELELQEKINEGKIEVWFFLDTSGSCAGLAERFWKAAKSLPPHRFDKKLFCFDTKVYEVDEKVGKLYGFGGTAFDIIEEKIQQEMKKKPEGQRKYPTVFLITDGFGSHVKPQTPRNWHWFLTENSTTSYVPKESNKYFLKDFE